MEKYFICASRIRTILYLQRALDDRKAAKTMTAMVYGTSGGAGIDECAGGHGTCA